MLSKSHDPSARIAEKRIACVAAVLSALLITLAFAGQAAADAPVTAVLKGVETAATTQLPAAAATHPAVPTGRSAASLTVPVINAATRSAGNVAAPVIKTVTNGVGNAAAPIIKAITDGSGNVGAPATKVLTQLVGSTTQTVVHLANPVTTAQGRPVLSPRTAPPLNNLAPPVVRQAGDKRHPAVRGAAGRGIGPITKGISPIAPERGGIRWIAPGISSRGGAPADGQSAGRAHNGRAVVSSHSTGGVPTAIVFPSSPVAESRSNAADGGSRLLGIRRTPAPSPLPGGAGGTTAAASGLGFSIFLTLAGLLLLAGPRALRRLRPWCEPWRMARFALIPERPG
jgi:hypothetical protein